MSPLPDEPRMSDDELMAKHPEAKSIDHALELERVAEDQKERESDARQEHANALAAHMSHPHTQLTQITKDLTTAPALDVAGRTGQLNAAVLRLIQVIKEHTPEPPPHPGEFNAERIDAGERREHAEGADQ